MKFTLIRGLAREQFHWDQFPTILRKKFPEAELEMLDLPGNGQFASVISPLDPLEYLQFLRSYSNFVKQKEKTIVISVSLGAMISYQWSLLYPEELAGMVFLNTSLAPSPFYRRMRPSGFVRLVAAAKTKDLYQRERKILELTTQMLGNRLLPIASEWGAHAKIRRTSLTSTLHQLWTAAHMQRKKDPPQVPCLLLSSEKDELVHPSCSEDLARFWGVSHKIHPRAGHDLALDDPEWVVENIFNFLLQTH